MNKNEKFVITINRELGSGGRVVGEKVAEKLGVPFYDKVLSQALTEKYNLSVEEIERMKGRSHSWWKDFIRVVNIGHGLISAQNYPANVGESDLLTTDDMFRTEQEVLKGIADDWSCVVAGRCGFFVFRQHPNCLSVLIQASMDWRVARVAEDKGISEEKAREIIGQVDKMRENYVNKYTGTSRYDPHNYDLVLRADGKTEDELADLILQYIGQ